MRPLARCLAALPVVWTFAAGTPAGAQAPAPELATFRSGELELRGFL